MSHILQRCNLFYDFLLRQLFPCNMLVLHVIRTVHTAVDTVVGQIQRRKHNNSIAIEILLDLLCQLIALFDLLLVLAGEKHGSLPVRQTFALFRLSDDCIDQFQIVLVGIGIGQCLADFLVRDKFLCL